MYITGALTGTVGTLAVLLFISVTINILAMIYLWRVKRFQSVSVEGETQDELYEVVREQHSTGDDTLSMRENEAYEQISSYTQNPSYATGL